MGNSAVTAADRSFLSDVERGRVGQRGHHDGFAFVGDRDEWSRHYIEGLVTYPGSTTSNWTPIELTDLGAALLASLPAKDQPDE